MCQLFMSLYFNRMPVVPQIGQISVSMNIWQRNGCNVRLPWCSSNGLLGICRCQWCSCSITHHVTYHPLCHNLCHPPCLCHAVVSHSTSPGSFHDTASHSAMIFFISFLYRHYVSPRIFNFKLTLYYGGVTRNVAALGLIFLVFIRKLFAEMIS